MENNQLATFLASLADMPVDKLVKLYVKTRETKAAATKVFEAQDAQFKAIMETIENHLLAAADRDGVEGFRTEYGTTYAAETQKISIADDTAFETFLRAQENPFLFFERRVSSKHVKDYMDNSGGAAPPGLNIFRERCMRIRKASGEK
ncbi:hypothetical protein [Burkholderia sp. BE12]|uniref:hypothetical protein n=1 Tax=Burkholderia sp. BE12 TaxID=2082394 RepID=UPI000CF51C5F|nr:hypothetical protein [Burkholderia sp. BE12]